MNHTSNHDLITLVQSAGVKIAEMSRELADNPIEGFVVKASGPNAWDVEGAGLYEHEISGGRGHHSFKADGVSASYSIGRGGPDGVVISDGDIDALVERAEIIDGVYARFTEAKRALTAEAAGVAFEPQF